MAKSIRSKHKRKMRAIKRVRYGQKELDRLKKTLGIVDNNVKSDVEMLQENNVINFVLPEEKKRQKAEEKSKESGPVDLEEIAAGDKTETMEIQKVRRQKGSYPAWMNQRYIRKVSEAKAKHKKLRKKKSKN